MTNVGKSDTKAYHMIRRPRDVAKGGEPVGHGPSLSDQILVFFAVKIDVFWLAEEIFGTKTQILA